MFKWKQFCFSAGEAIRQEGVECAMRRIGRDGRHSMNSGQVPSIFGLGRTLSTTAPKSSVLTRIPSGRTIPSKHETL